MPPASLPRRFRRAARAFVAALRAPEPVVWTVASPSADGAFAGRTVVVTGAAGKIGRGLVAAFSAAGAHVVHAVDHDAGALAELRAQSSGRVVTHCVDLTDEAAMREFVGGVEQVDVLVHGAAVHEDRAVAQHDEELWRVTLMTNVAAPALLTTRLEAALTQRPGGAVVVLSSINGAHPSRWPDYAASKAALDKVTDDLARYFAPHGVRVNSVVPGQTEPIESERMKGGNPLRPLGRTPVPVEAIAHAVLFLADSERSPMTTGQHLVVDGAATHGGSM